MNRYTIDEFVQQTQQQNLNQGVFELETERMMELNLNGEMWTKMGSMIILWCPAAPAPHTTRPQRPSLGHRAGHLIDLFQMFGRRTRAELSSIEPRGDFSFPHCSGRLVRSAKLAW